jgi:drug/metabolite transporter (DMT)-like permease
MQMLKYLNNFLFSMNIAALLITSGCFLGSIQKVFVKIYLNQTEIFLIIFYQYFFGFIFYLPKIIKTKFQILKTRNFLLIALRALLGVIFWLGAILSLKYIPLLDTSFLLSMTPLWVPLLAYCFFSEKIDKKFYFFILTGLLGVAFILMPDNNVFNFGGIPALISSLCWAGAILLTAKLTQTENIETILSYYFLIASIITAPLAIFSQTNLKYPQIICLFVNATLMVLHQELINRGYSYPKAYNLSILTYTNIFFSGLFAIFFFNEIPNFTSLIGMILVLYSCLYVSLKFKNNG